MLLKVHMDIYVRDHGYTALWKTVSHDQATVQQSHDHGTQA